MPPHRIVVVAIDGLSGAGKSTIARRLADRLQFTYIDTGATDPNRNYVHSNTGLGNRDIIRVVRK